MAKVSSAREGLIDAAVELFRARGYEGVGVAELLEKSGAPRGSLYFHFPGGKEEIGVEAVRRVGENVNAQFRALHETGCDMAYYIQQVFKTTAEGIRDRHYKASCPIAAIAAEMGNSNPKLNEIVRAVFAGWEKEMASAARARGMTAKNANSFASAMLASIEGAMIVSKAQGSVAPHINAARAMKVLAASLLVN
ncbi:MAG: TetR/AcrR family transcriptional regulator [Proteobacteria bacterium]|nr:TetR/AcrR family transcriptional regulator [Pseudomonadota bacterium]